MLKFVHRKNSKRKLRQKKSSVLQKKSRLKKNPMRLFRQRPVRS